jgi:hypothetical protein
MGLVSHEPTEHGRLYERFERAESRSTGAASTRDGEASPDESGFEIEELCIAAVDEFELTEYHMDFGEDVLAEMFRNSETVRVTS